MPLSKRGKKILRNFIKEYGKSKGLSYFYGWEHKNKSLILKKK